ncbi:MAG: hypothetical protein AB8F78_17435 [Saprospiraceae bacterium]
MDTTQTPTKGPNPNPHGAIDFEDRGWCRLELAYTTPFSSLQSIFRLSEIADLDKNPRAVTTSGVPDALYLSETGNEEKDELTVIDYDSGFPLFSFTPGGDKSVAFDIEAAFPIGDSGDMHNVRIEGHYPKGGLRLNLLVTPID